MEDNWIIENLEQALSTWNSKLSEIWELLSLSPEEFKGGSIWQIVIGINEAMQAVGLGLLILFFAMSIFKSSMTFRGFQASRANFALLYPFRRGESCGNLRHGVNDGNLCDLCGNYLCSRRRFKLD